jgi:hypothetical protein
MALCLSVSWQKLEIEIRETYRERGGPCWLLKLRQMGTQRVHMKEVLPWLVHWARRAGTRDLCPALAALVSSVQNVFPRHALLVHFIVHFTQQAGQAVVPSRLSINLCLWLRAEVGVPQCIPEKRYSIEHGAGKAARLASWRKMTQPGEFSWWWYRYVLCVRIFPGMKLWTAWVHYHRKYSTYHHELNHAQPAGARVYGLYMYVWQWIKFTLCTQQSNSSWHSPSPPEQMWFETDW